MNRFLPPRYFTSSEQRQRENGLSRQELAETLGIPIGTVKSRLNAAKRAVRASLEAAGGLDR